MHKSNYNNSRMLMKIKNIKILKIYIKSMKNNQRKVRIINKQIKPN